MCISVSQTKNEPLSQATAEPKQQNDQRINSSNGCRRRRRERRRERAAAQGDRQAGAGAALHADRARRVYVFSLSLCPFLSARVSISTPRSQLGLLHTNESAVHPSVSDDLAQLALLYNMNGAFEKALPLLHKRLVIHEKFGPGAWRCGFDHGMSIDTNSNGDSHAY